MVNILEVENLNVAFAEGGHFTSILKNVNFNVPKGKTVALVGESGSGKTTISTAIMGLLPAGRSKQGGRILFRDTANESRAIDLASLRYSKYQTLRGRRISMAFQEPSAAFSPVISIGAMLSEMLHTHERLTAAESDQRIVEMLDRVGFSDPTAAMRRYPFELSGGLRQRAMLACALICKPALVIADEPTSALDVTVQALTLKLLSDLRNELGLSLLIITHDFGVVANIADDVVVLRAGEVVEQGDVHSVLKHPQTDYTAGLLATAPRLTGEKYELPAFHPKSESINALAKVWRSRIGPKAGTPFIEVDDISKSFSGRKRISGSKADAVNAVLGVSLKINAGECVGLVGESGCGKSTLSKLILRVLTPDSGTVRAFDGRTLSSISGLSGDALMQYRARVQYVFQDPYSSLNPRFTAREIVTEPFLIHGIGTDLERLIWAEALFEMVGLDRQMLLRHPSAFSGGQRQRIGIARALALGPDLLVCDEPVSALDVSVQGQILSLIDGLRQDLHVACLFVSHNLAVVRAVASRVLVMCSGRIVESAPAAKLFADARHPYTVALLAAHPEPDPDRKLNLSALMDGRASEPSAWPKPFALQPGAKPRYEKIGEDHFVAVA